MNIAVTFKGSNQKFTAKFASDEQKFVADFGEGITVLPPEIGGDYPLYSGPYTVTPKAEEAQVLSTEKNSAT